MTKKTNAEIRQSIEGALRKLEQESRIAAEQKEKMIATHTLNRFFRKH